MPFLYAFPLQYKYKKDCFTFFFIANWKKKANGWLVTWNRYMCCKFSYVFMWYYDIPYFAQVHVTFWSLKLYPKKYIYRSPTIVGKDAMGQTFYRLNMWDYYTRRSTTGGALAYRGQYRTCTVYLSRLFYYAQVLIIGS